MSTVSTNLGMVLPANSDPVNTSMGTLTTALNVVDGKFPTDGGGGESLVVDSEYTTGLPSLPSRGVIVMSKRKGGRRLLSSVGPSGVDVSLQPSFFANNINLWDAQTNATTTTNIGWTPTTSTLTAVAPATTNLYTMASKARMTSAATSGSMVEWRNAVAEFGLLSTAGAGGWYFTCRFGFNAVTATQRFFCGLQTATAVFTNVDPTSLLNIVGLSVNTTQTNFRMITNDGSGTATSVDLTSSYPSNTTNTDWYDFRMFAASGSTTSIGWSLERLNNNTQTEGTIITDLPTGLLAPHVWLSNGTTATAVGLDIGKVYVETDN